MVTASHADATTPGLLAAATATTIFVRGHISVFIVSICEFEHAELVVPN